MTRKIEIGGGQVKPEGSFNLVSYWPGGRGMLETTTVQIISGGSPNIDIEFTAPVVGHGGSDSVNIPTGLRELVMDNLALGGKFPIDLPPGKFMFSFNAATSADEFLVGGWFLWAFDHD